MVAPDTGSTNSKAPTAGNFATTHWSVVLAAGDTANPDATAAIERLCATYWLPVYAYLRRFGSSPEEAEDLTQDFFAHFLAHHCFGRADPRRGRFRTFLLTCAQNYLRDAHDRARATRRGGRARVVSLDKEQAERGYAAEPVEHMTPERIFEKRWATTLLENVLAQLGAEFSRTGKREFFEDLKMFVWGGGPTPTVRLVATRLGVSESAVRTTVHRLRQRFRELLRLEITHTVSRPEEIDEEIRYLAKVLHES